jgi:hypothetical protein
MIQHEITISFTGWNDALSLTTMNRDLKGHREDDLPAHRNWLMEGSLFEEMYYLNGLKHREGDLPAVRRWDGNGTLRWERYYLKGEYHREDGPAWRVWRADESLWSELHYLEGEEYDPT